MQKKWQNNFFSGVIKKTGSYAYLCTIVRQQEGDRLGQVDLLVYADRDDVTGALQLFLEVPGIVLT